MRVRGNSEFDYIQEQQRLIQELLIIFANSERFATQIVFKGSAVLRYVYHPDLRFVGDIDVVSLNGHIDEPLVDWLYELLAKSPSFAGVKIESSIIYVLPTMNSARKMNRITLTIPNQKLCGPLVIQMDWAYQEVIALPIRKCRLHEFFQDDTHTLLNTLDLHELIVAKLYRLLITTYRLRHKKFQRPRFWLLDRIIRWLSPSFSFDVPAPMRDYHDLSIIYNTFKSQIDCTLIQKLLQEMQDRQGLRATGLNDFFGRELMSEANAFWNLGFKGSLITIPRQKETIMQARIAISLMTGLTDESRKHPSQ